MEEEKFSRRFYILNTIVAFILLASIFISINQFGVEAWHNKRQIALILPSERNSIGWNRSQYFAAKSACEELEFDLIIRENVSADFDSCNKIVSELSNRGIKVCIFANGCKLRDVSNLEKAYPKINFFTIESISFLNSESRYSILSFEASYLAGILAGLRTSSNKIGYIAPYSESEVNQCINAYTLGAQRVNPEVEVILDWTNSWDNSQSEEMSVQNLKAAGVDFLTYHQNGETVPNACARLGINFVAYNEVYPTNPKCLAAIKINWSKAYADLIRYNDVSDIKSNYVYGIADSLFSFEILGELNKREKVLLDTATWEMENGRIIFSGEIFDRTGIQRCGGNETISLKSLQENMNWLIKGVKIIGS